MSPVHEAANWLATSSAPLRVVGWVLLHSTWQGLLVWIAYRLVARRATHPVVRYAAGNACLLLFFTFQIVTATVIVGGNVPAAAPDMLGFASERPDATVLGNGLIDLPRPTVGWADRAAAVAEPLIPWLVMSWVACLLWRVGRQVAGVLLIDRLLDRLSPVPADIAARFARLAREVGVGGPVRFLSCPDLKAPAMVGWLRPTILVPLALLTSLPPDYVDAVIRHELAHVRRRDYMWHLLRSLTEAVYYFHPCVRAIVRALHDDAEVCCDRVAARSTGDVLGYARALVALADLVAMPWNRGPDAMASVVLSAAGGSLRGRVLALLADRTQLGRRPSWAGPSSTLLVATLSLLLTGTGVAASAHERREAMWAASRPLPVAVLETLDLADDGGPAVLGALSDALAAQRGDASRADVRLVEAAVVLARGTRWDLLYREQLPHVRPDDPPAGPMPPGWRYGTPMERIRLARRLNDLAAALPDGASKRDVARAAVVVAAMDAYPVGPVALTRLLRDPSLLTMLGLTAEQRGRLVRAAGASQARGAALTALLQRADAGVAESADVDAAVSASRHDPGIQQRLASALAVPGREHLRDHAVDRLKAADRDDYPALRRLLGPAEVP